LFLLVLARNVNAFVNEVPDGSGDVR